MTFSPGQVLTADQLNALDINSLTVDTDTLVVDATNNRVGINKAAPSQSLDVVGSAVISDSLTVDTSTLKVDSANNRVGIGTASPATALDVRGTTDVHGNINMKLSNNSSSINFHDTADGTFWHVSGPRTSNNNLNVYWNDGSTYHMVAAFDENKRLGINTQTPAHTLDVNGVANVSGDVRFNNNALVASYASSTNIDHIWHDDGANAWHFCSDRSYKAAGNSELHAGQIHVPGNVVAMYEYWDNVVNRSINGQTTIHQRTITTQGNTRLIMQLVSGQFVKSTSVTNLNIKWSIDNANPTLTAGSEYLETNHVGYGANNFREQLVCTANTGTLSAGNHTVRVFAESYGNHTVTLNYQSANRSTHLYIWEVCV